MSEKPKPIAVLAVEVPVRSQPSIYPELFASRMVGREKRQLGEVFGLTNFGVRADLRGAITPLLINGLFILA